MRPPIAYYGSKTTIAPQIVTLLPEHEHYVEPYCGSLAVLLAKPRSRMETVNDLDRELMTWWRVLRDRPAELERACALTPHSRAELIEACEPTGDDVEVARRLFVRLTQSRTARATASGGRWRYLLGWDGISIPGRIASAASRIEAAAGRLEGVSLECRPALDVVADYGRGHGVLLYVDPPYLAETRSGTNYRHEMPNAGQHRELAAALRACTAAVVLSGYPSPLYDDELYPDWYRHEIHTHTSQGGAGKRTVEVLWSNRPLRAHRQQALFAEWAGVSR